ncbi:MAG: cupin domain-containing protein [Deltaproteobacteria bacterium]|nr:MAG: cupin domain-containing protein [Deltaproteobacteria bacterium]
MDVKNLDEMMATKKRNTHLFGGGNFRSWMLYFVPGDGTDMHYHANPETFLVLSGSGVVKGLKGEERPIRKNEVLFLEAKDYYQITNNGTEPLVLFGNRSEAFGGPHVKTDGSDRNANA